jgi:hypothetical protein
VSRSASQASRSHEVASIDSLGDAESLGDEWQALAAECGGGPFTLASGVLRGVDTGFTLRSRLLR